MIQPQYTMHNFNWLDQRGIDGTPLVRTLRSLLTNNLPQILPEVRIAVSVKFDDMIESHKLVDGWSFTTHSNSYSTDEIRCQDFSPVWDATRGGISL